MQDTFKIAKEHVEEFYDHLRKMDYFAKDGPIGGFLVVMYFSNLSPTPMVPPLWTLPSHAAYPLFKPSRTAIKYLNMIGLKLDDLSPLREMQLHTLCLPLQLRSEDFAILKELNLQYLVGPGDDSKQSIDQFM